MSKPATEQMDIHIGQGGVSDSDLKVTIKGRPTAVIQALVDGLPVEALQQIHDALENALADRKKTQAS